MKKRGRHHKKRGKSTKKEGALDRSEPGKQFDGILLKGLDLNHAHERNSQKRQRSPREEKAIADATELNSKHQLVDH